MEEQGNEDVDQQKKVKFEEKEKDEQAPQKKETKENKEHRDEEDEEEGRRSRASRSSRACSADALNGKSDDEKNSKNEINVPNTGQEENKTSPKNNSDRTDGLGDDLEILEKSYKQEENEQISKNELDIKNDKLNERERKESVASKISESSKSDEDKLKTKEKSKTVEFDRVSNASGYSLNSRRSNDERKSLTETSKVKSPVNSKNRTPQKSKNKSPAKTHEEKKTFTIDGEESSDFRTSIESLSSEKAETDTFVNNSDDDKAKTLTKEDAGKTTINKSNTSLKRETEDETNMGYNEEIDEGPAKKSETDIKKEPVKVLYGKTDDDLEEQGHETGDGQGSTKEEPDKSTNEIDKHKQSKHEEDKNFTKDKEDPQYQIDEDGDESTSQKSEKEKEPKITIKDHKPPNNKEPAKHAKISEPKSVTVTTTYKKPPTNTVTSSEISSSNQSYPRATRQETMSPRAIVAEKRKDRRQQSQSARYPSQNKSSARNVTMTTRASSRASTLRSSRPPSRARTSLGFSTERRRKEKEFFHAELQRLKESLRKESKKIKKPKVREHYPYVFTNLGPYYDTYTANYLINMPDLGYKENQPEQAKTQKPAESEDVQDLRYTTRCTAIGLCDPCVSLSMDRSVLPKLETAEIRRKRIEQMHATESKPKSGRASSNTDRSGKTGSQTNNDNDTESPRQKRPEAKQGSTRLPKFPVIAPPDSELSTKELHYGDVQMLREEVVKKFSHYGEDRKKSDYERTKQDFYRMELDRLDEYHQTSRPHMRAAYFAYLQNTPGSRKAIYDCLKEVTNPKKKEEQSPQAVA